MVEVDRVVQEVPQRLVAVDFEKMAEEEEEWMRVVMTWEWVAEPLIAL